MNKPTLKESKACIRLELRLRRSQYPKWVASGLMRQEWVDHEIAFMDELYKLISGMESGGETRNHEKMSFEDYWNQYGELHASFCKGDIKVFAREIWESAQGNGGEE